MSKTLSFIKKISIEKRKQNIEETYWGKPVTGFGDLKLKLMIIRSCSSCTWWDKNWYELLQGISLVIFYLRV